MFDLSVLIFHFREAIWQTHAGSVLMESEGFSKKKSPPFMIAYSAGADRMLWAVTLLEFERQPSQVILFYLKTKCLSIKFSLEKRCIFLPVFICFQVHKGVFLRIFQIFFKALDRPRKTKKHTLTGHKKYLV